MATESEQHALLIRRLIAELISRTKDGHFFCLGELFNTARQGFQLHSSVVTMPQYFGSFSLQGKIKLFSFIDFITAPSPIKLKEVVKRE